MRLIALFLILALCRPCLADTNADESLLLLYDDHNFVSIATGRKQLLSKAPAIATVITSEEIRATGAQNINDVLETVPGLHVSVRAGGFIPIYTIRGISSEFNPEVLVLVNGAPQTSLLFGNKGEIWVGVPIETISRIEVIRGPGSAIYGADAFSGVINIITKTPEELQGLETGFSLGSFNTQRSWLQYGGQLNSWRIGASLSLFKTDGEDETITQDAQSTFDTLLGTSASLAPGDVNTSKKSLDARLELANDTWNINTGYQAVRDWRAGVGGLGALDPYGTGESDRFNVGISYRNPNFIETWDVHAQLNYLEISTLTDMTLLPPGFDSSAVGGGLFPNGVIGIPSYDERHTRLDLSAFNTSWDKHNIRIGSGFHHLDFYRVKEDKNFVIDPGPIISPLPGGVTDVSDSSPFNQEKTRKIFYFFVQDEWQLSPYWSLTSGVRYDHYSDFGSTLNPRAALVWDTSSNLTTKLLYGRAFRAPSFAELFNINNPVALGNDTLDPETIDTYELAFDYAFSPDMSMGLSLFYYEIKDIIRFNPAIAANTGKQIGRGFEWEFEWSATENLSLLGNFAYQRSKAMGSHNPFAPSQQLYIGSKYQLSPSWSLSAQMNWVMGRKREASDTRSGVKDFTTFDLNLVGADIMPGLKVALSLKNLTNERIFEPSLAANRVPNDLPRSGRSLTSELVISW